MIVGCSSLEARSENQEKVVAEYGIFKRILLSFHGRYLVRFSFTV